MEFINYLLHFLGLAFDPMALWSSPQAIIKNVLLPPLLYGLHGWAATWCAVKMLFRPYNPKFIPFTDIQIWFTPGIFPKRQSKLAQAVATTITDTLLTPADIKKRAEELVTEENIYKAIDKFFDTVLLKEFRDASKLHRLASDVAKLSPPMLQHFVQSTIDGLEHGKDTKVPAITEKIFDQVVLTTRINLEQATEISARIMENFLTPQKIRSTLITLLSPQNINALDESINVHASGPYRILARLIGVKRVCYEWRTFFEKEPEQADKIIEDLMKRFGIKHQLAVQIANFDLRTMPLENINNLKKNVVNYVVNFLLEHKADLVEACRRLEDEAIITVQNAVLRFNPDSVPAEALDSIKRNIASFTHSYLKQRLGDLVEEALPALAIHHHIVNKIDLFTPQQLEYLVHKICKQELKALEYFGLIIGSLMGIIQIVLNAIVILPH